MALDPRVRTAAWLDAALAEPTDQCIDWPFTTDRHGYPQARRQRRLMPVSRIVLERAGFLRPPPPNHFALHSCDRPICVNPRHLRWGTRAENTTEAVERGRVPVGERNGSAVLTDQQVADIRAAYARGGISQQALADRYGVNNSTICVIVNYKSRKQETDGTRSFA